MSLTCHRTLPLRPAPLGGLKKQNGRYRYKIALRLKKVCYQVSLCENCQRWSCKAFIGLTIHAKMNGGATPSSWYFGSNWPRRSEIADFYSASALLAMQSAVLARGIPSIRRSVCPSVTFRCFVQTNKDAIVRFPASGRTIILVSGEVKFIRIFAGDHPSGGVKVRHPSINGEHLTNNRP